MCDIKSYKMSDEEDIDKGSPEIPKTNGIELDATTKEILSTLTPRELKVLRARFGVDLAKNHSVEEIDKQFEVTRERIKAIEEKALSNLRTKRGDDSDDDPDDDDPDDAA